MSRAVSTAGVCLRRCVGVSRASGALATFVSSPSPTVPRCLQRGAGRAFSSTSPSSSSSSQQQQTKRPPSLSPASLASLRTSYETDGYAIARGVLDGDLVGEMSAHLDWITKKYPKVPTEHLHHLIMRNDPFWVRLATDARLVDLAQGVGQPFLGSGDIALFSSHYFLKKPRTGMDVLWHQDGSYWPLKPMNVLTLWVAVDHSTVDNGCLRVVRGSHASSLKDLKDDRSVLNVLGSATHTDADLAGADIVDLQLAPGDVSIHHPNIVHGSKKNTSATRRCGLTIRYISTATEVLDAEQPVMLVRGEPVRGVNAYRSWPKFRQGYDMPFKGSETWNSRRNVQAADEAFFARTDYANIDKEIEAGLWAFIDKLGGR